MLLRWVRIQARFCSNIVVSRNGRTTLQAAARRSVDRTAWVCRQAGAGGRHQARGPAALRTGASGRRLAGLAAEAAVAIDHASLKPSARREIAERTAQLQEKEQALRQSQKMEAVGQLTGGIAHDFNNLLQVILGNLESLQRHLPQDSGRLQRSVNQAVNGARRAAALTQPLLAFSRQQPLDPKPIDVNALV